MTTAERYGLKTEDVRMLRLLAQGCRAKDMAGVFSFSVPGLRYHLHRIRRMLHAATLEQAIYIATRRGII